MNERSIETGEEDGLTHRWRRLVIGILAFACVGGALYVVGIAIEEAIQADCTDANMDYGVIGYIPLILVAMVLAFFVYCVRWIERG